MPDDDHSWPEPMEQFGLFQRGKDVALNMKAEAKSFLTKPASFDEWVEIMKSLAESWLEE